MAARLEVTLFWLRPHCFCCVNQVVLMLISWYLHEKSREVCIKARSPPASLAFIGQVIKHTTVKQLICDNQLSCPPLTCRDMFGYNLITCTDLRNLLLWDVWSRCLNDCSIHRANLHFGTFAILGSVSSKYGSIITRTRMTGDYDKKL